VKNVEGTYAKPTFDAAPDNVDGSQTFNGGDLSLRVEIDTWGTPVDDPPDPVDPTPADPDAPAGGCTAAGAADRAATSLVFLLVALLLGRRRRRRS
jgi:MYXO-CTERM domain-containing protein